MCLLPPKAARLMEYNLCGQLWYITKCPRPAPQNRVKSTMSSHPIANLLASNHFSQANGEHPSYAWLWISPFANHQLAVPGAMLQPDTASAFLNKISPYADEGYALLHQHFHICQEKYRITGIMQKRNVFEKKTFIKILVYCLRLLTQCADQ